MAFWIEEERKVRPLTVAQLARMRQLGVLGDDDRVELLLGMLVRPGPRTPAHEAAKERLTRWLVHATWDGAAHDVTVSAPLAVPDQTSLPTPDVAVVPTGAGGRATALLVIEVAAETIRADTEVKPPLYAAAGVPELWVVEPEHERVHVFDEPGPHSYGRVRIVDGDAQLTPRHVDAPPLALATLFAPVGA